MRVLQLCAVDFTVRNFLTQLVRFLESKGCAVVTACSPGEEFARLETEGFRMKAIDIRRSYNLLAHRRSIHDLTRYLRREPFDVVHVHTPVAALIGRIAATRAGVPVRLYTAHGFYFHDRMPTPLYRAHVALERFGARRCDFVFTQSEEDRQTAIRERIMPEERIATIGNGVDLQRFSRARVTEDERARLRAELRIAPEDRVITIIGRLVAEKGYGELFEAVRRLRMEFPRLRLLVIGKALPSDRDSLAESSLGEAVIFAGLRRDIPALLSLAEVYTLPSWREGMPRSIIEAMALGLPVVATAIRGCREEVVEGQTGHLVPVRDPSALAEALGDLLRDPRKALEFGRAGRARAELLYDERDVLLRQWEVYERFARTRRLD